MALTFSIIVAVRNGMPTLRLCLDALLKLEWPEDDREIIVVDNGSDDGTGAVLQSYGRSIVLRTEFKRGASAARNHGLRAARGRYVAILDADCVAHSRWLNALLPALQHDGVGVVGGRIRARQRDNRIARFGERIHDQQKAIEVHRPPYVSTSNWASPAAVLREHGGFDENLLRGQDADLAWRIYTSGYRLVYAPDAIVDHHHETTFAGLFSEGVMHGGGLRELRSKHASLLGPPPDSATWLVRHALRRWWRNAAKGPRFEVFCRLVFDLGKAHGWRRAPQR